MKRALPLLFVSALLLTACEEAAKRIDLPDIETAPTEEKMEPKDDSMMMEDDKMEDDSMMMEDDEDDSMMMEDDKMEDDSMMMEDDDEDDDDEDDDDEDDDETDDSMMMEDDEDEDDDSMMMEDDKMMEEEKKEEAMEEEEEEEAQVQAMVKGQYSAYTDGVIGNGEEAVLFFHATWCPYCQANDKRLNSWYPADGFVNVYKIDYDTVSSQIKSRYGVVQQDTFVRIDGKGNAVDSVSFPSETALRTLVSVE